MKDWILISNKLPERGVDVEVCDREGNISFVYLCERCGSEWRSSIGGYGMMINPIKWRLRRDNET